MIINHDDGDDGGDKVGVKMRSASGNFIFYVLQEPKHSSE
jgi:hypothetical protein